MNIVPIERACTKCEHGVIVARSDAHEARAVLCRCSSSCDTCGNSRYVFSNSEWGGVVSERCFACSPAINRVKRFNAAKIPTRYTESTFDSYQPTSPAQHVASGWFESKLKAWSPGDRGLLLSGDIGTGKTHLMCAWARHLTLHRDIACRFVEFSHLLADLRAGYSAGKSDAEIIRHLVDVPVLIIDELGKALANDWQIGVLDALISQRYNRNVSTFFTTNYAWQLQHTRHASTSVEDFQRRDLGAVIGERMASRIDEMCDRLHIDGDDFRRSATSWGVRRKSGGA